MKTIKILCLTSFLLFTGIKMSGQSFRFGFLTGFDLSNILMTNKADYFGGKRYYYPLAAFNINGYVGTKFSNHLGISLEPGFIKKGSVIRNDKDNKSDNIKYIFNYIQLPVLADIYLSDKFFFSVGPELAYLINAKAKSKDNSNDLSGSYDKNFELSILAGVNYSISKKVDIGLRYNHGITCTTRIEWTDASGNSTTKDSKEYNQYFQLLVRYKI
jgi:hypothetical protein